MKLFHRVKPLVWLLVICLLAGCAPGGDRASETAAGETAETSFFPGGEETEPSGAESVPQEETTAAAETTEETTTEPEGPFPWMDPAIVPLDDGRYDVTPAVEAKFPGYDLLDARFLSAGTLLLLLKQKSGSDGMLAKYSLTGEVAGSYEIVGQDMDSITEYLYSWLTEQDGKFIVRLADSCAFAVLDENLHEVSRVSYAEYVDLDDLSSIIYLPAQDELVYTVWSDHNLHVADCAEWKYYTPFEPTGENSMIDTLYLRSDGMLTFECSIGRSKHMVYDPETREIVSGTYTQKHVFVGKEKTASVYTGGRRAILWGDEWKSLTYPAEYQDCIVDPDRGIGVSVIMDWRFNYEESDGCVCMAYDLASGERISFAHFDRGSYGHVTGFGNPSELISLDAENGLVAFVLDRRDVIYTPAKDLVLWDISVGEAEVPKEIDERLAYDGKRSFHTGMDLERLRTYLEQKYGVEICLGDECENKFWDVEFDVFNDEEYEFECLLMLEDCLVNYPEGFFTRLAEFYDGPLTFYICTSLNITGIDIDEIGIHSEADGCSFVLIEALNSCDRFDGVGDWDMYHTIYHEVGHALERVLFSVKPPEYDGAEVEVYFDWEVWDSLQPEGFEYRGFDDWADTTYTGQGEEDPERIYFVDNYATTNELEDRARTIEYAMLDTPPAWMSAPHLQAKMRYYFGILREVMGYGEDVELWWERVLVDEPAE